MSNKLTKFQQSLIVNLLTAIVMAIVIFCPAGKFRVAAYLLSFSALVGAVSYFIKSGVVDE